MDHKKREILNSSEIRMTVTLKELTDGMEVTVKAEGLDKAPLRVEICIPAGSVLENEHFHMRAEKAGEMVLRDGFVNLIHEDQKLLIGPVTEHMSLAVITQVRKSTLQALLSI